MRKRRGSLMMETLNGKKKDSGEMGNEGRIGY